MPKRLFPLIPKLGLPPMIYLGIPPNSNICDLPHWDPCLTLPYPQCSNYISYAMDFMQLFLLLFVQYLNLFTVADTFRGV